MKVTVKQIRKALKHLPDNLPVEFRPITGAWLGTMNPMRFDSVYIYDASGNDAEPSEPNTHCTVHLVEDYLSE